MLEILEKDYKQSSDISIGLSEEEAVNKRKQDGENKLSFKAKKRPLTIFTNQFKDIMVIILLIATFISALLGEIYDALTIIVIVFLNASLGFIQEYRTEKTLETLERMTTPKAKVYRNGKLKEIDASEIVKGDIIEVEAGDRIPCDALIISSKNFYCDESILTGETLPSGKRDFSDDTNLLDLNLPYVAYMGTNVTRGNARLKAFEIGNATQIGKVSCMIEAIEEEQTPLQKKLGELGKTLAIICIIACVIVFVAGILRGEPFFDMLMTGITIAIAAIPEGLPATVTIALALAVRRMLKRNALVHKLHSVETLGCASVICTDKTGTVTENKMTVTKLFTSGYDFDVLGSGHKVSGEITYNKKAVKPNDFPPLKELLVCGVLCENSKISKSKAIKSSSRERERNGEFEVFGDPTEIAVLIACAKGGVFSEGLNHFQRIDEIPFESETRFMSVKVEDGKDKIEFSKGSIDVILNRCENIITLNGIEPLNEKLRHLIIRKGEEYASDALRVLAFSKGTTFLGLMGMIDPPREEAKKAIRLCKKAHIKTVMITGDHKLTAVAVARQAGIFSDGDLCITGEELKRISDERLSEIIDNVSVFARVNPSDKLRIVKAFKRRGDIVAMTGDGVNDAPAVKEADIGVSMGITGTDVTKQAADVILLDDNFSTLVSAVEEGRTIYANIKNFVRYLISCNIGEVLVMFFSILLGFPRVLLPTQLLLVNLATDGLPAIALSLEPSEKEVMESFPRKKSDSFLNADLLTKIIFRGIFIGLSTLFTFVMILRLGSGVSVARTGALFTLVISQLIHVFECKNEARNIFTCNYFSNPYLIFAVISSLLALLATIYVPQLQLIFSTVSLNGKQVIIASLSAIIVPIFSSIISKIKN